MAPESSSISQSLLTKDDFEGLELTEFDPNVLQELLHEPGEEVKGGGATLQSTEVAGANPVLTVETHWCHDDMTNDDQSFNWLNMVEETSAPCNDMEAWYGVECMEDIYEFLEMGEYLLAHSAIMPEEIGYIGLWQENQDCKDPSNDENKTDDNIPM